jgi:predicted AlkP superfamily phosphohydrolase/phosphomutase
MSRPKVFSKRVVVLGMDALDYKLMKEFIEENELPNFKRLKEIGSFSALETVCPAESAVVWTSFATGMGPGNHGMFDFIMRNPENYSPFLSITDISSKPQILELGPFKIPLLRIRANKKRKSPAFWEITSKYKIPTYVYFCPNTFPPDKVYGKMISGMGVPDIRGTMGTFSFYTTKPLEKDKYIGGLVFQVERNNNVIDTFLYGPRNSFKSPPQDVKIPFRIKINPESNYIVIEIQDKRIFLKKGEWSNWEKLVFKVNASNKVKGICKFYLKGINPDIELYISPINFDPQAPFFAISYPKSFSKKLAKENGLFYTQGMPYDTWALNEGRINEDIFLEQANSVLTEKEKIFKKGLLSFKGGVFFFYFEYPDPIQHMFLHFQNREDSPYKEVVLKSYKRMDDILGWVIENIDEDTTLMVLSDHGFGPFKRAVHLNGWLRDNGFLYLKDSKKESKEFFEDVDWLQTKAYALGFGGIYINQMGREARGIVLPGKQAETIKEEIIEKLSHWNDSKTGDLVVKKTYAKEEVFDGKFNQDAPDLFVGFNLGYRASWQTALGAVPSNTIEDNLKAWASDHIFDASLVPGVVFINRKIKKENLHIVDIAPTILDLLDIEKLEEMDGQSLLK